MRIWSILLIKSDLKCCIHLSRSFILYYKIELLTIYTKRINVLLIQSLVLCMRRVCVHGGGFGLIGESHTSTTLSFFYFMNCGKCQIHRTLFDRRIERLWDGETNVDRGICFNVPAFANITMMHVSCTKMQYKIKGSILKKGD